MAYKQCKAPEIPKSVLLDFYARMSIATLKDIADGIRLEFKSNVEKSELVTGIVKTTKKFDNVKLGGKVKIIASDPHNNQNDISKFIGTICTVADTWKDNKNQYNNKYKLGDIIVKFIDPKDGKKVLILLNKNEYEVIL